MKSMIRVIAVAALCVGASACAKIKTYEGPEVTMIEVWKSSRKMYLLHHDQVLANYDIDLGFGGEGPKRFDGDGKTPEGAYHIDRRNPNSAYHLSLGISYPNDEDRAYASSMNMDPGGDIFIHGQDSFGLSQEDDWTAGCIAVENRHMREIFAMVKEGTPIVINP